MRKPKNTDEIITPISKYISNYDDANYLSNTFLDLLKYHTENKEAKNSVKMMYKVLFNTSIQDYPSDTLAIKFIPRGSYDKQFPLGLGFELYNSLQEQEEVQKIRLNNTTFYDWYSTLNNTDIKNLKDNINQLLTTLKEHKIVAKIINPEIWQKINSDDTKGLLELLTKDDKKIKTKMK